MSQNTNQIIGHTDEKADQTTPWSSVQNGDRTRKNPVKWHYESAIL